MKASQEAGIPVALLRAVIEVESGANPDVVSPAGAQGLMQLMPVTASYLDVKDPFDPEENVAAGARLLRILSDRFNGDIEKPWPPILQAPEPSVAQAESPQKQPKTTYPES